VSGKVQSNHKEIVLRGSLREYQKFKISAMGGGIFKYTSEEVLTIHLTTHDSLTTNSSQMCKIANQLTDFVEETGLLNGLQCFRLAHDVLFREVLHKNNVFH